MYGLLGSGNIWSRYNYLKIWNPRAQRNQNIEQIVQNKILAIQITYQKFLYIYSKTFPKYLHGTWSLLNVLMILA